MDCVCIVAATVVRSPRIASTAGVGCRHHELSARPPQMIVHISAITADMKNIACHVAAFESKAVFWICRQKRKQKCQKKSEW